MEKPSPNEKLENVPSVPVVLDWRGFEWIGCNDADNSVFSFMRRGKNPQDLLVVVLASTQEVSNSDSQSTAAPTQATWAEPSLPPSPTWAASTA